MGKVTRLTERDLNRIVKKVIKEESIDMDSMSSRDEYVLILNRRNYSGDLNVIICKFDNGEIIDDGVVEKMTIPGDEIIDFSLIKKYNITKIYFNV